MDCINCRLRQGVYKLIKTISHVTAGARARVCVRAQSTSLNLALSTEFTRHRPPGTVTQSVSSDITLSAAFSCVARLARWRGG